MVLGVLFQVIQPRRPNLLQSVTRLCQGCWLIFPRMQKRIFCISIDAAHATSVAPRVKYAPFTTLQPRDFPKSNNLQPFNWLCAIRWDSMKADGQHKVWLISNTKCGRTTSELIMPAYLFITQREKRVGDDRKEPVSGVIIIIHYNAEVCGLYKNGRNDIVPKEQFIGMQLKCTEWAAATRNIWFAAQPWHSEQFHCW